jgi:hypothetical protein
VKNQGLAAAGAGSLSAFADTARLERRQTWMDQRFALSVMPDSSARA